MKAAAKSDRNPTNFDAQELLALARIDIEKGSLESALQKIKQLLVDPEVSAEGIALAGRLYAQLGIWDRAQELFQRYLALNPQAVTEKFQLGMIHFDASRSDEALKIWAELLQKHPLHPPALFYRGLALAQQGKTAEARQSIDVLLKSVPADNLYFGRGKELLQSIETQTPPGPTHGNAIKSAKAPDSLQVIAKDAYKTEH